MASVSLHGPGRFWRALAALLLVVAAFGAGLVPAWAQGVLPIPALTARVIDQTGTLNAAQQQALDAKLAAFEQKKGSQIVVLMVPTTAPEDLASYANRVGNAWKIGRKNVGDGVLVIVAKNDRQMRIEVAKTLEGALPDIAASRIIDGAMKPRFRENDFAGGLDAAVDQIIARVNGEALPDVGPTGTPGKGSDLSGGNFDWAQLGIFLFFGVLVIGRVARSFFGSKLGPVVTGIGAGAIAMVVTSSIVLAAVAAIVALLFTLFSGMMSFGGGRGGRSGALSGGLGGFLGGALGGSLGSGGFGGGSRGGGGGGFGGGFGSGGGGDFGGGGASGDW